MASAKFPKLAAALERRGSALDAESLRKLLDSEAMVKLFEANADCILPETACPSPAPGSVPKGLGATAPFGTARLREMALAHFEGTVVQAIDAHYHSGTEGEGWTAEESLALHHFLAALEYPMNPEYTTTLGVLRAWSRKGGVVAVENTVLGGIWTPEGWNGIPDCRFIPNPHLSLSELEALDPNSERGRACTLWEQMMA
ncbi:unnamed protein product [Symbiodinium natans]|uniref:Uncharacterized protein n=1 Tax=Symbiodinium natans TaxID=878477 RepID=A0A812JT98_9DINO|nr:unnamed protein product [Symbiodinium natans]